VLFFQCFLIEKNSGNLEMKKENKKFKSFLKTYWIEIILLFITPIIVSFYGINKFPILKDLGFFSYIGQEFLRGYPIYSTVYINYSPLVAMFFAFSMSFFNFLPQYLSIRLFMLIVTSLMILIFYKVVLKIFNDKIISTLSALILISFTFFIELTLLGDSKTLALFFCFFTFVLFFRENYFLSGISASFCFLFYQPIGLFLLAPLIFIFLGDDKRRVKIEKFGKILLGFFIPLILLIIYFFFYGSVMDFINFHVLYAIKYEKTSIAARALWAPFNILGYYSSEFFFLLLGLIGFIYTVYKITKKQFLKIFCKNKYLTSFALPFFLLSLFVIKFFDDGSDIIVLLPAISVLAAFTLRKIQVRSTKIISNRTHTPKRKINKITILILILIVCSYGFFPALQPVYPENPIIRNRDKFVGKSSPIELILNVQREFGVLNSLLLFLFHRKGEQITIEHQLELAKIIQNNTNENEKILSLSSPEILFLSKRRNLNPYPLFVRDIYNICRDRGDIAKTSEEIKKYKPKFILANEKQFIEKLELTEFIEKNYEKMPFIYYTVYRLIQKG